MTVLELTMSKTIMRYVILVAILAGAGQMANTISVPAMDYIANDLLVKEHYVQLLIAGYIFPYGLCQLIVGPLSDKFGRRPMILIGVIIFIAGCFLAIFAKHFYLLTIACVVQGVGISVGGVMARTVMRDLCSGKALQQVNSFMSMLFILAPLIAPVIGGTLTQFISWRAIYVFLFIFGLICFAAQFLFFKETISQENKSHSSIIKQFEQFSCVLQDKTFLAYVATLTFIFSGSAVFEACAGLLLGDVLHYTAGEISLFFIIPLPFYVIGSYFAGYLAKYFSIPEITLGGIWLALLSAIALFIPAIFHIMNVIVIIIPISMYFLAGGIIFPTATTGAIDPFPKLAGKAGALAGGCPSIGAGIVTIISSTIAQESQLPLAIFLVVMSVLSLVVFQIFLVNPAKLQV